MAWEKKIWVPSLAHSGDIIRAEMWNNYFRLISEVANNNADGLEDLFTGLASELETKVVKLNNPDDESDYLSIGFNDGVLGLGYGEIEPFDEYFTPLLRADNLSAYLKTVNGNSLYGQGNIQLLSEAPIDNKKYARKNGTWVEVTGGSGTSDYDDLENKPKIASIELVGNKSLSDLGIASASDLDTMNYAVLGIIDKIPQEASTSNKLADKSFVNDGLSGKADSSHTHDDRYYTEAEVDTALSGKANASHTHSWGSITDKPNKFPPTESHGTGKIQIGDVLIQWGSVTPSSLEQHSDIYSGDASVTFPTSYVTNNPAVIVIGGQDYYTYRGVTVSSISTTGFTVKEIMSTNNPRSLRWMSIGHI